MRAVPFRIPLIPTSMRYSFEIHKRWPTFRSAEQITRDPRPLIVRSRICPRALIIKGCVTVLVELQLLIGYKGNRAAFLNEHDFVQYEDKCFKRDVTSRQITRDSWISLASDLVRGLNIHATFESYSRVDYRRFVVRSREDPLFDE